MVPHLPFRSRLGTASAHPEAPTGSRSAPEMSGRSRRQRLTLYGLGVLYLLLATLGIFFVFFNALWPLYHFMPGGIAYPVLSSALLLFVAMLLVATLSVLLVGKGLRTLELAREPQRFAPPEEQTTAGDAN